MSKQKFVLRSADGKSYYIAAEGLTIGSLPGNQIVIEDPRVAGRHAQILLAGDRCWVRSERATTGTYINGQRIAGQQELGIGDVLQIGSTSFQLFTSSETSVLPMQKRRNLALLGIGAIAVLILLFAMASGRPDSEVSLFARLSSTPTATFITMTRTTPTEEAMIQPTTVITLPVPTSTVMAGAVIACENTEILTDLHVCQVKNLGDQEDKLWLSLSPHSLARDNHFNLTVVMEGEPDLIQPNRRGMLELGDFGAGEEKIFVLQMYCVDTINGCPLTEIHLQLLADDGDLPIAGGLGEFSIINAAYVEPVPPTRRPPSGPGSTDLPAPVATSTPSDAVGPTPTP